VTLSDNLFPCIKVGSCLLLIREIEIFQHYEVSKKDGPTELKQKWFTAPQKDPNRFKDKKNPTGNWKLFADNTRMIKTGHTLGSEPIEFGDNVVAFRAPNIRLGDFTIPEAFMNEAFMGERYVHRLGELELIRESQGVSHKLQLGKLNPQSTELIKEGIYNAYSDGEYFYDGPRDEVGTIRLKWRFVKPQDMTIAAEAVAPGRACTAGYGPERVCNIQERKAIRGMIWKDLTSGFREDSPLLLGTSDIDTKTIDHWTVTPFPVDKEDFFPPHNETFLGRLWMHYPGRLTSSQLFRRAHQASSRCLWKVRALCYVALFLGWCLVFEPLTNIFRVPLLQSLLSLFFATFAFVLSTSCCLTVTAISRITARPGQSILIIATVWVIVVEVSANADKIE
jgi:hypothetical protein